MPEGFVTAPWTGEQVDALNRYQRSGVFHEFTCKDAHDGLDRTLFATREGWRCPHCEYVQNWAHESMLQERVIEALYHIPCDVMLPPATVFRKGCSLSTLMVAFKVRMGRSPEENRFHDPVVPQPERWNTETAASLVLDRRTD